MDCERVLVTLLRGLGPWKDSVFLIGGLAPRYLVRDRPPVVPAHAGTLDVDIVVDLQILADTQAYHSLEENSRRWASSVPTTAAASLAVKHSSSGATVRGQADSRDKKLFIERSHSRHGIVIFNSYNPSTLMF